MLILYLIVGLIVPNLALRVQTRALRTSFTLGATSPSKRSILRRSIEKKQKQELSPEEVARIEWEALDRAAVEAGDAFQEALEAKLEGWKRLKEEGVLDKIDESFSEEDMDELDELSSKLLGRKLQTSKKALSGTGGDKAFSIHGIDPNKLTSDFAAISKSSQEDRFSVQEKIYLEFSEKLKKVGGRRGSSQGVSNILNEMKDKGVVEGQGELVEECLMAMSRLDSAPLALAAFRQYRQWVRGGDFSCDGLDTHTFPSFSVGFVNSCLSNGLIEAGNSVMDEVLAEKDCELDEISFLPGVVCATIFTHAPWPASSPGSGEGSSRSKKTTTTPKYVSAVPHDIVLEKLRELHVALPQLSAQQVNPVIRMLGKKRLIGEIFALLDAMRDCAERGGAQKKSKAFSLFQPYSPIRPDNESFEFLANALVATVDEESKGKTMKDLPQPVDTMPEVLLMGRSNVGKSSLVNFLVNRKALASVSATPGHTTQFHFFAVNSGRADLPSFRFVDVPGLGYAEAEDNTLVSWRSLLARYLTVRDSLGVVLHLIDSRHKLTPTDKMLLEMGAKAAQDRHKEGKASTFQYCVVLTKCDRASDKNLRATLKDIEESTAVLSESMKGSGVPVIVTSSIEKRGRDEIWRILQGHVL